MFTLTVSPFTPWSAGTFFAFVLLNALFQASFGAYFQAALVRLASLFGPYAMQAFFTGQAAVGVGVSAVQFVAAALAGERKTSNDSPSNDATSLDDDKDKMLREASTSAFWFFSLSTGFLVFTYATYLWLTKLPIYHEVVHPHLAPSTAVEENEEAEIEEAEEEERSDDEGANPMSGRMTESGHLLAVHVESQVKDADLSVLGVAKLNLFYNLAVGYVFIVTLVSPSTHPELLVKSNATRFSLSSPRLQLPSVQRTQFQKLVAFPSFPLSFSPPSTSSSSISETTLAVRCALIHASTSPPDVASLPSPLFEPSSFRYFWHATFNDHHPHLH